MAKKNQDKKNDSAIKDKLKDEKLSPGKGKPDSKKVEKLKKQIEKEFDGKRVNINKLFQKIAELSPDKDTETILASRLGVMILSVEGEHLSYYGDLSIAEMNSLKPDPKYTGKEKQAYQKAVLDCKKIVFNKFVKNE